jgi:hypothetical protein
MSEVQSLPDQIERIGHALTAAELAELLAVSRITVFKQAKAGRNSLFQDWHLCPIRPESCGELVAPYVKDGTIVALTSCESIAPKLPLSCQQTRL